MRARPWGKIRDWNALEGATKDRVAEIVKVRLRAARDSGAPIDHQHRQFQLIDVLVIGYVNGIPQIMTIDETGGSHLLLPHRRVVFMGGAKDAAWIVSEAFRHIGKWEESEATIRAVMDIAIGCCSKALRPPTQMVIVTRSGAERLPVHST